MIERILDCAMRDLPISYGETLPTALLWPRALSEPVLTDARNLLATCPDGRKTIADVEGCCDREALRHILLGSPGAIRQAIHQLHVLNYAESVLWSPLVAVNSRLMITPEQGEAMSLLRR